jgi:hypothetical protein
MHYVPSHADFQGVAYSGLCGIKPASQAPSPPRKIPQAEAADLCYLACPSVAYEHCAPRGVPLHIRRSQAAVTWRRLYAAITWRGELAAAKRKGHAGRRAPKNAGLEAAATLR